jgi:Protein of unknown function (DUF3891)
MIIRKESDGSIVIMGQTDHSRLVGQVAAHWGNAQFATPAPYDSVVRAATFHDYGWLRYETSPQIDPANGEPYPFLKVPLDGPQMASYQWSLDWMADIDPYSGLLVNMHRTGLWKRRYETIKHPMGYNLPSPPPEIVAFIQKNEGWQQQTRATLDANQVWTNYVLLQVWDLLGLYFCCQEPYEDYIDPVPLRYGADRADPSACVRLSMKPVGKHKVAFDPYPFDIRPCRLQLGVKRLAKSSYANVEAFRRAYFQADTELLNFELV